MDESLSLLAYLAGAAALKHTLQYLWRDRLPTNAVRVGTVSQVTLFPVKSMGGTKLHQAECTFNGLRVGDIRDR